MKNADYWRGRFSILEESAHQEADHYIRSLEEIFVNAQRTVQADIERWYGRFASNNGISLTDARKMLTTGQLEEFRWTVDQYIKIGEQSGLSAEWIKKLKNASAKFHVSRLEAVQLQIQQQIELLYGNHLDSLDDFLKQIAGDGYTKTAFTLQKGLGLGWDITALNQKKLEALLSKPWTTDGRTFSDRIWMKKQELIGNVQKELIQGLLRGDSSQKITDAIKNRFNVSRSQAGRLVHTETTYFNAISTKQAYQDLGVEKVEILETLDSHTCEICGSFDGGVIPLSQYEPGVTVPPFHPSCRGTTSPHFDDMDGERAARNADGEVYYVPADMTYEQWKKAFVDGGEKDGLTLTAASGTVKLTDQEQYALNEYISSGSYKINAVLRSGEPLTDEQKEMVRQLDSALEKMPTYQGTVYRSMDSNMILDMESFWKEHTVNMRVVYPAYTSSSTRIYDEGMDIQLIIKSKNGRDIRANNSGEMEILFPRNSKFRITEVDGQVIYMEEE